MSFAKEVKEEISKIKADKCCYHAELSALLWINSLISLSSDGLKLEYQTTNSTISRRFVMLVKALYDVEIELLYKERERLNRSRLYIARILKGADNIIMEHGLLGFDSSHHKKILDNDCCRYAFIRGAFLASGSINDPNHSYHMEIACQDEKQIIFLQKLMNDCDLNAKITRRRKNLIVYLKEASKIADLLNIIGSKRLYFQYEDTIIKRDISNSINRVINVELANEQKTVASAKVQIEQINFVIKMLGYDNIEAKMLETMNLRLENPDSSLNELVAIAANKNINLTKSGLNHRFRKISELYNKIKENMQ